MAQNVFEDLGFPPEEARELKRKSNALGAIREYIADKGFSTAQVREITGLSHCDVSHIVNGKIVRFSIDRLMRIAEAFDAKVSVSFEFPKETSVGQ